MTKHNYYFQKISLVFAFIVVFFTPQALTAQSIKNSCAQSTITDSSDPFLSLEEIDSANSLAWVKTRNELSFKQLSTDPRYQGVEEQVRKILLASDRLAPSSIHANYYYRFWQDTEHKRGLWQRMPLQDFKKGLENWDTLLDIDKLALEEKENWVYQSLSCKEPENKLCLIRLSRGGGDSSVVREFDVENKKFVANGFILPEAKSDISWVDDNTVLVATDWGDGSLTSSGYPRLVRLWSRGTASHTGQILFSAETSDVGVSTAVYTHQGKKYLMIHREISTFGGEYWLYQKPYQNINITHSILNLSQEMTKLPIPKDAELKGFYKGHFLISLRNDWQQGGNILKQGSLISLNSSNLSGSAENIYTPDSRSSINAVDESKDFVFVTISENVKAKILAFSRNEENIWTHEVVKLPSGGTAYITSANNHDHNILLKYENFLQAPTLYLLSSTSTKLQEPIQLRSQPSRFNEELFEDHQYEATSKDGTKIPYSIVHAKGMALDGRNPTLLYGYGGFEISLMPSYLNQIGKVWLESGGVYVRANIRGGGEFGPQWHIAGTKENKQRVFDDFIAVAEDLITRRITSPRHLGIQGGSNGGLLVGAVSMQRPELFAAVLCQVPLLDMLRYHKLLAGASWMEEYGNPEDPKMYEFILKYSPYQNIYREKKYPEIFFLTSTRDDRVHPGHARKMAARLADLDIPVLYYENTEGGHAGSANLEQKIKMTTMEFTYLMQKLF